MAIFCAQSSYCVLPHLGCLPHTLSTSGFFSRFLRTVSFSELFCALARMVLLDDFLAQGVGGQVLGTVLDAGNPVWNCISNLASAGPNLFTLQMKIIHCSFTVSWLFCVSFMFYNSTRFKTCKDPHKFHQPRFGRSSSRLHHHHHNYHLGPSTSLSS